jgi:hypothetical protein
LGECKGVSGEALKRKKESARLEEQKQGAKVGNNEWIDWDPRSAYNWRIYKHARTAATWQFGWGSKLEITDSKERSKNLRVTNESRHNGRDSGACFLCAANNDALLVNSEEHS